MYKYNEATFYEMDKMTMSQATLFTPLKLGELTLANRIVLPPLTRCRSEQPGNIPGDMIV